MVNAVIGEVQGAEEPNDFEATRPMNESPHFAQRPSDIDKNQLGLNPLVITDL